MQMQSLAAFPGDKNCTARGDSARSAGRKWLARALTQTRERTLSLFDAYEKALAGHNLTVPLMAELNPPLWELGHIGWFQEWWIQRNPQRGQGAACAPDYTRPPSRMSGSDALYDSGNVPHDSRWSLPLPDAEATRRYLRTVLDDTLVLLDSVAEDDASLYFFRLALLHEDMHAEAGVYMAQSLGIPLPADIAFPRGPWAANARSPEVLRLPAQEWQLGRTASDGFSFDNEHGEHGITLAPFEIDTAPVNWQRYLPFVESGGYTQAQWWTADGYAWREGASLTAPRYLKKQDGQWLRQGFGLDQPLDLASVAVHLSFHEAQAWCHWAGRRLPTEAEWECAAMAQADFHWGGVWEWTGSPFLPYPGFTPHPYRDYSAPWFGSRQVLRGACTATAQNILHPRYRNFFTPERNDIFSGFRSCAVALA